MPGVLGQLASRPLTADGPITRRFRAAGAHDFAAAARHVQELPSAPAEDLKLKAR